MLIKNNIKLVENIVHIERFNRKNIREFSREVYIEDCLIGFLFFGGKHPEEYCDEQKFEIG